MARRVLLADDEDGVLALLAATLADTERYQIFRARDGNETLRIARRERPALLLLDVLMPKKDGYEVCQTLKEDPATAAIKVVMLTVLAQEFDWRRAMEAGADDYLTKPFSPTALLVRIEQFLAE